MRILGVEWVGLKVNDMAGAEAFFVETLGVESVRRSETRGFTSLRLPSGQLIELFGPQSREYELHETPVVAGFEVEDVQVFREEMAERGVEFMTDVEGGPKSGRWCYFRGPEGSMFQVFSRGES